MFFVSTRLRGEFLFRSKLSWILLPIRRKSFESSTQIFRKQNLKMPKGLPEWLWSHGKWKVNDMDHGFFGLQDKLKPILPEICTRNQIDLLFECLIGLVTLLWQYRYLKRFFMAGQTCICHSL